MADDRLFILDISGSIVAGVSCEADKRSLIPIRTHFQIIEDPDKADSADRAAGLIGEVVEKCEGTGARCFLSLPASAFSFKNLTLPFTDSKKIRDVLNYELLDSISFPEEPFVFDSLVTRQFEGKTEILAAILKEQQLQYWLDVLKPHDLVPDLVTVSALPLLLDLCNSVPGSFMYLDIDRSGALLFYVENGRIRTIRSIEAVPAEDLEPLSDEVYRTLLALGIDFQQSTEVQLVLGGDIGLQGTTRDHFVGGSVFSRVLHLDSSLLPNSAELLVERENRLPQACAQRLLGCMGVDSKNRQLINVIRSKSARVGSWALSARIIPILVLTALVFIGAAGYQIYDYNRMLHQRNVLIDEVESIYAQTLGGELSVSDPVRELKSTMDEMNQSPIGDAVHRPNLTAVAILSDISERIPASVTVSFARFSFDRKQIKIDGVTDTFNDVDSIRTSLEASSFYSGVAIDSATNESNGQGVRFTFSLNL